MTKIRELPLPQDLPPGAVEIVRVWMTSTSEDNMFGVGVVVQPMQIGTPAAALGACAATLFAILRAMAEEMAERMTEDDETPVSAAKIQEAIVGLLLQYDEEHGASPCPDDVH